MATIAITTRSSIKVKPGRTKSRFIAHLHLRRRFGIRSAISCRGFGLPIQFLEQLWKALVVTQRLEVRMMLQHGPMGDGPDQDRLPEQFHGLVRKPAPLGLP